MLNFQLLNSYLIKNRVVIVINGPTASGKTGLSIDLATLLDSEIISADSRQIYKFMDIGTAKPRMEEQNGIKHHLIDFLLPNQDYSAGKFRDASSSIINKLYSEGKVPIICGGTGFYIKSLFDGLFESEEYEAKEIRELLDKRFEEVGIDPLYDELMLADPVSAKLYENKNKRRVLRALEYYLATGTPLTQAHKERKNFAINATPIYFQIKYERAELYNRINQRTEIMWQSGLKEETQKLLEMGYSHKNNALNTVGYKETISFLNGEIDEPRTIELISQNTRRYAKRQLTWNNQIKEINWIENKTEDKANFLIEQLFLQYASFL